MPGKLSREMLDIGPILVMFLHFKASWKWASQWCEINHRSLAVHPVMAKPKMCLLLIALTDVFTKANRTCRNFTLWAFNSGGGGAVQMVSEGTWNPIGSVHLPQLKHCASIIPHHHPGPCKRHLIQSETKSSCPNQLCVSLQTAYQ